MGMYKTTETIPPSYPTADRLSRLHSAGIDTDGHIDHLRTILSKTGYNLPSQHGDHWGFIFRPTGSSQAYTRLYLAECDAMAEELLMLKEYGMI